MPLTAKHASHATLLSGATTQKCLSQGHESLDVLSDCDVLHGLASWSQRGGRHVT